MSIRLSTDLMPRLDIGDSGRVPRAAEGNGLLQGGCVPAARGFRFTKSQVSQQTVVGGITSRGYSSEL